MDGLCGLYYINMDYNYSLVINMYKHGLLLLYMYVYMTRCILKICNDLMP